MTHPNDILLDAKRLRLLAAALELQHLTSTAANVVPIPGGDRVIAIGTRAEVAQLLDLRDHVLVEARDVCERVRDACQERDSTKWPELRDDAAGGAGDCVAAIEALRTASDSEGGHHD